MKDIIPSKIPMRDRNKVKSLSKKTNEKETIKSLTWARRKTR